MDCAGAMTIARGLGGAPSLVHLNLRANSIGDDGGEALAEALLANQGVSCPQIRDVGPNLLWYDFLFFSSLWSMHKPRICIRLY